LTRLLPISLVLLLAGTIAGCGSSSSNRAATVNGHDISMTSYNQEVRYDCVNAASQYGFDVCKDKGTKFVTDSLKKSSLEALIQVELIQEYAAKHHIAVSALDFNRNWTIIYQTKFGSAKVLKAFVSRYGMTVADLKTRLRNDLLKQRVEAVVTAKTPAQTVAIRLARLQTLNKGGNLLVRNLLRLGKTFPQIAVQLGTNTLGPCKTGCGDLGWIPIAFLPTYQSNLATARVGKVVGPLALQQSGFEYFQVEARDAHYTMTTQQQSTMRNKVMAQWLSQQEKRATIKRFTAV
jgi:SurA N-terminal domain